MKSKLQETKELLKIYNQEHLLQFYHELKEEEKRELIDEINEIDFELIQRSLKDMENSEWDKKVSKFSPLKAKNLKLYSRDERVNFYEVGIDALAQGKVAVFLVAGGQGTRLGHKGPKGTFNIGLPSGKSLFQLQCERLINLSKKAEKDIPLYIMTSDDNHEDTVSFFESHNYFGYKKEMIMFFKQNTMAAAGEDGKILLGDKHKIVRSPNGNGGCFIALKESGALSDMRKRGVQWIFLYGIDNALVRVADPYFIGFTIMSKLQGASKVVAKKYPEEKVGILCYKNSRPAIVEYTEIPKVMTEEVDESGKLVYSNSNILNHLLSIDFIESILDKALPLHVAHKRIEYVDKQGKKIEPKEPNGYKFEYFLFDVFERLEDMAALEVEREEEFAPVKNSEGNDSPQTARELILSLHKKWLEDAGVNSSKLEGKQIEISPLVSYYGENLSEAYIEGLLK